MKIATIHIGKRNMVIERRGRRSDQGGQGVVWACSCGAESPDPCDHILGLFHRVYRPQACTITTRGRRILSMRATSKETR